MTSRSHVEARVAECLTLLAELGVQVEAQTSEDAVEGLRFGLRELLRQRRPRSRMSYSVAVQLQSSLLGVLGQVAASISKSSSPGDTAKVMAALQSALDQASDTSQFAGDQLVPQERSFAGDELVEHWAGLFALASPVLDYSVTRAARTRVIGDVRRLTQVGLLAIGQFVHRPDCPNLRVVLDLGSADGEGRTGLELRIMPAQTVSSGVVSARAGQSSEQAMSRLLRRLVAELGGQFEYDGPRSRIHLECPVQLAEQATLTREPGSSGARPAEPGLRRSRSLLEAKPGDTDEAQLRALIVEDNPINARVLGGLVKKLGLKFDVAHDGNAGVAQMRACEFDVVLMDCEMPVMDGFEATRRIRRLGGAAARTPIIAVTSHAESEDRERCLEAGMDDYVSKPIRKDLLVSALTRHVPGFARMTARAAA